jgi:hypothetical protein
LAINPNPVDQQMTALTQVGPQPIAPTSVGIQAQPSTPPGFTPKPQTTAQSILQSEGISSSKQLLSSMKVPSAKDILAEAGIPSAADVLGKEKKKQEAQAAWQKEMNLREQEKEFMKNYKITAESLNPTAYETKYGNLDFKDAKISNGWGWQEDGVFSAYQYRIDGKKYYFLPEEVATKGAIGRDNNQRYNYGFLNKDTWAALAEKSQAMDLSNMDTSKLQRIEHSSEYAGFNITDDRLKAAQTRGFLFSEEDWNSFRTEHLDGKWRDWGALSPHYGVGKNQYGGNIQGLSQLPSGELIYVTQPSGGHDSVSTYIASDGQAWLHWYDKPSGILADIGNFLNSVPLLPEIAVLATGGPASPLAPFYPAMKGAQVHAAGGDLGDVAASVVGATVATSPVMQNATASLTETFTPAFGSAATAEIAATAVVQAGFAGTMAALTGQDVEKAVLAGALSGGFQAGTPAIAEAMFKGTDVTKLANAIGLEKAQFQNITVSALSNSAIQAAVYDRDFGEMFTQSLVVNGLSTSAANKVYNSFKGNMDNAQLQKAIRMTKLTVQATARSAIRGTDINVELNRALSSFTTSTVLDTARDVGKQ